MLAFLAACVADSSRLLLERVASRFPLPPPGTDAVGELVAVRAHAWDTLPDLARYFDVGHDAILDANPQVNARLPGAGTRVLLPTQYILPLRPRQGVVVNLAALRLYYYLPDGHTVVTHPAGVGRGSWSTPEGSAWVVAKDIDPAWHVPPSIRAESARFGEYLPATVPPGSDNPLGQYALRLNLPGYLIHGTNRPYGIGMRVSHGCIQLYPEDISALFPKVPIGTRVTIINQPYLAGRIAGRPYLEAHLPQEEVQANDHADRLARVRQAVQEAGIEAAEVDWNRAWYIAQMAQGIPLPIYRAAPTVAAVLGAVPMLNVNGSVADAWVVQ